MTKKKVDPKEKPNRHAAHKFFLTYSTCGTLTREQVLAHCESKGKIKKYLIASELHQDGQPHIHAFIEFENKFNWKGENTWVIDGHHCKAEIPRSDQAVANYCTKEGNYITNYWKSCIWTRMNEAPTEQDAIDIAKKEKPRELWLHSNSIRSEAAHQENERKRKRETYVPKTNFILPATLQAWIDNELPKTDRAKCLVVYSPTRYGKTCWARSLGKHIYWKLNINLDKWDDTAQYIVIDDIEWEFLPYKKGFLTCAGECEVTDKYRKKKTIVCNKPAILLTNEESDYARAMDDKYWKENMIGVWLHTPLFDLQHSGDTTAQEGPPAPLVPD